MTEAWETPPEWDDVPAERDNEEIVSAAEVKNPLPDDLLRELHEMGHSFKENVLNDTLEVNGVPISDSLLAEMNTNIRRRGYKQVNVMHDAMVADGRKHQYHPVQEYLESIAWDGEDHIKRLSEFFSDREGVFYIFFKRWLIGAVARAYVKTQNVLLTLCGAQGIGKSTFPPWLVEKVFRNDLFVSAAIRPDDKDSFVRLIATWVWEVSEMGSTTRRADVESLKHFLSLEQVTVRKAYGHFDLVKPALASFIGTCNPGAGFLNDPSGSRRFVSVNVTDIDWAYATEVDQDQLWAQAKALYDAGEPWVLLKAERELADEINAGHEVQDPLVDLLHLHYKVTGDPGDFVTTLSILETLRRTDWRLKTPRGESMAVANALASHEFAGITPFTSRVNGKLRRGYCGINKRSV